MRTIMKLLQPALLVVLALSLGCGGGGSGGSGEVITPIPVATPVITAPTAASYNPSTIINISTQQQDGCSYSWTVVNAIVINGQSTRTVQIQPSVQTGVPISISLRVYSPTDSKSATATIQLGPQPTVPTFPQYLIPTTALPGSIIQVSTQSYGSSFAYTWSVTDGTIQSGQGTISVGILPTAPGSMFITCTVSSNIGLTESSSCTIPVLDPTILPPPTPVISGPTQALLSGSYGLVFSTQSQTGYNYQWDLMVNTGNILISVPQTMGTISGAIVSGQGTNQVVINTVPIGGGGGSTRMFVRVIISKSGQQSYAWQQLSLLP